jgi:hypothetical protein
MHDDIIEWSTPEFEYKEKDPDWYWILGIIVVSGMLLSFFLDNVLFGIFIALGGFILAVFASKHPETLHITINKKGVRANSNFYPFRNIDSFWVDDDVAGKEKLIMTPHNTFALQIVLPIGDVDPDDVRDLLELYVHEEEQSVTLSERIMEYFHI